MIRERSQILPELLDQAESAFYGPDAVAIPAGPALHTRRGRPLSASPDLAPLDAWLPRALDEAIDLVGADRGDIRILDPRTGSGRLVACAGFDADFIDHFEIVAGERTPCGRAAARLRQVAIDDLGEDDLFGDDAAALGIAALQSTPLRDHAGRLLGVLSTHWDRPRRHRSGELRLARRRADLIGEELSHWLIGAHPVRSHASTIAG